jgi:CRP-like cAMP-binding protein
MVIADGEAMLVLIEPGEAERQIGDVGVGETIGVFEGSRLEGRVFAARAITDCEAVVIDATVAGQVASRNVALATALNRLATMRERRVDRLTTGQRVPSEPSAEVER